MLALFARTAGLRAEGAHIVAVSDSKGGVHEPKGLNPAALAAHKKTGASLHKFPAGKPISNEQLLELAVDILVPAALENQITGANAESIHERVKVVAEGVEDAADDAISQLRDAARQVFDGEAEGQESRVLDLEAVVDAAGLDRFVLYAYSAGGPTGIAYTVRHPERVAQLVLAALLRKSLASPWPWALVLLATLANEWNDLYVERWSEQAMQYGEIAKDIALTMLLPSLLLIAARWCPRLIRQD